MDIVIRNNKVEGVITHIGSFFPAKAVVLTTGTYLKGKIIIGDVSYESGPMVYFRQTGCLKVLKNTGYS